MIKSNAFKIYQEFFDEVERVFQQAINVTKDSDELHHMAKDMRLKAKELISTQKEYLRREKEFEGIVPYADKMEFQLKFSALCKKSTECASAVMVKVRKLEGSDRFLDFSQAGKCRLIIDRMKTNAFKEVNEILEDEAARFHFKFNIEKKEKEQKQQRFSSDKGIATDSVDEPSVLSDESPAKVQDPFQNSQKRQKRS